MRIIVSVNDEHLLFEKGKDVNAIVEFLEGAVAIRRNDSRTGWEQSYKETNVEVTVVSDSAVAFLTKEPKEDDIPIEEAANG
jgi:hypothetical protein